MALSKMDRYCYQTKASAAHTIDKKKFNKCTVYSVYMIEAVSHL